MDVNQLIQERKVIDKAKVAFIEISKFYNLNEFSFNKGYIEGSKESRENMVNNELAESASMVKFLRDKNNELLEIIDNMEKRISTLEEHPVFMKQVPLPPSQAYVAAFPENKSTPVAGQDVFQGELKTDKVEIAFEEMKRFLTDLKSKVNLLAALKALNYIFDHDPDSKRKEELFTILTEGEAQPPAETVMEEGYYTPEPEELCVGMEVEQMVRDSGKWNKFVIASYTRIDSLYLNRLRVKHLAYDDIVAEGFEFINSWQSTKTFKRKNTEIHTHGKRLTIKSYHNVIFEGRVKNKTEFKKLLKQIGE